MPNMKSISYSSKLMVKVDNKQTGLKQVRTLLQAEAKIK